MKISKKQLSKIIKEHVQKYKSYINEYDMGWGDSVPGPDDETQYDMYSSDVVLKTISDFLLGTPVDKIFSDWKVSNKKGLVEKILQDKKSYLVFDGDHLHWMSSSGNSYFKVPAGSGIEVGLSFSPVKDGFREKMHDKGSGPAPEGKYVVQPLQTAKGKLRDSRSIIGACGFYLGSVLKALGVGKTITLGWSSIDWSPMTQATWGNYRSHIKMREGANPSNRSSLYLHGGYDQSSAGCIDLASENVDSMNIIGPLYTMWYEAHGRLILLVDYSKHYNESLRY